MSEPKVSSETASPAPTHAFKGQEAEVRPEYLLPKEDVVKPAESSNGDSSKADASKADPPKKKGRNKDRPAPMKFGRHTRLCPVLVNLTTKDLTVPDCTFPNCAFIHDLDDFMEKKPEDIGPECFNYRTYGECPRGFTCRFAGDHVVKNEGDEKNKYRNIIDAEKTSKVDKKTESNRLDKEVQIQLRKKKYDFKKADQLVDVMFKQREKENEEKAKEEKSKEEEDKEEKPPEEKRPRIEVEEGKIEPNAPEKKRIDWKDKVYLAPLTTVGNLPFRRICKRFGVDITCGEMAMGLNLLQGHQPEWALVQRHKSEDVFGIQICGCSPNQMTRVAQLIEEQVDCDFVDINLGCPIDLVYKRGMGSGLMGRKKPLEIMVRSMSKIMSRPLTVKMRTGIYQDKSIAHSLIPSVQEWGADMVTLHGRSREQRYTRLADWQYIKKCCDDVTPFPVYGNGDIMNYEDYNAHKAASGVSGVMVARGALIKPWVFTEIKEQRHWDISASERLDMIKDYVNYGLEHWGSDDKGVETTRRFLLEWLSFLHRYVPHGILVHPPQRINERLPTAYKGRSDLETLLASPKGSDWIRISEMFLGKVPEGFGFVPKHKANSY